MTEEKAVAIVDRSIDEVKTQVAKVQQLMKDIMKPGEHYGKVPGTSKNTLLKAGAEKLGFTFRLTPKFEVTYRPGENGHREYEVVCTLTTQAGTFAGQGVGICSTMERKYRYRKGEENPDLADTYNTVLKMAKKRAHVDAVITACAASDIFTQDIEDITEHKGLAPEQVHALVLAIIKISRFAREQLEAGAIDEGGHTFLVHTTPSRAIEQWEGSGADPASYIEHIHTESRKRISERGSTHERAEVTEAAERAFTDDEAGE